MGHPQRRGPPVGQQHQLGHGLVPTAGLVGGVDGSAREHDVERLAVERAGRSRHREPPHEGAIVDLRDRLGSGIGCEHGPIVRPPG